jgi:hypothetical protein
MTILVDGRTAIPASQPADLAAKGNRPAWGRKTLRFDIR